MRNHLVLASLFCLLTIASNAQFRRGGRIRIRQPRTTRAYPSPKKRDSFKPSVNISVAYGYPNLDKNELVSFNGLTQGNVIQTGPYIGSLDYRYNPSGSVGVMVIYGKVAAPYYLSGTSGTPPLINGSLESWSILFNSVRYLPGNKVVTPYLRTAIGVNIWNQNYTDQLGNKQNVDQPNVFAYQGSLGAKFNISNNTGLFIEAGYGKYIVSAGLSLKL